MALADATTRLPANWRLHWDDTRGGGPERARRIGLAELPAGATSVSMTFHRAGLAAFGGGDFPLGPCDVVLPAFPGLDDLLTLYAWARREAGSEVPHFEVLARYAEDVRQGRWPDGSPVERAVQAVYLTMAQHLLLRTSPDRLAFVADAFALLDHLVGRLVAGDRLPDDDLVSDAPFLRRYVNLLEKDRDLYREDRQRAFRFHATIPGRATWTGAPREVSLLAVEKPLSTQFKLWARRDPDTVGRGYALLAVLHANGWALVSADPDQRIRVGWLAESLTAAEHRARGDATGAWNGARYEETLCESPKDGTRLTLSGIVSAIEAPLALRPEGRARARKRIGLAVAVTSGVAALATLLAVGGPRPPPVGPGPVVEQGRAPDDDIRRGIKGRETPPAVRDATRIAAAQARVDRALVIGANTYDNWGLLNNAENDAEAIADLLKRRYGFEVEKVVSPSMEQFANLAIKYQTMAYGEFDQLLIYVSGHGHFDANRRQGYLIFRDSGPESDVTHRNWYDLDGLRKLLETSRSRHILLILDTCYSGTIDERIAMRGEPPSYKSTLVLDFLEHRSRLVMTSVGKREAPDGPAGTGRDATGKGHSPFTQRLIEVLSGPPDAQGFVTFLDLQARMQSLSPSPVFGTFDEQGADQAYGFVLEPRPPRPPHER
jgi:hypothetical protein